MFVFLRQFLLDIAFEATKEVRAEDLMQLRNTLLRFVVNGTELDGTFERICGKALGKNSNHRILITRTRKPLAELLQVREVRARHQKLQQRPQLRQVVLERSARQQQPPK